MVQVLLWFWYLVFLWWICTFGSARLIWAAQEDSKVPQQRSEEEADSERKLSARIADFFIGSGREGEQTPQLDTITVIASRLPSFRTRLSDIPANVSYFPANVTYKGKEELARASARMFQDSVRDAEGAIFYDQVGNGIETNFGLRGFSEGSAVIVIVDGVRVNELDGDAVNYPLLPMNDVEMLQIDRGSASHIYGSGAFAGIVWVETRKLSPKLVSLFGGTEVSSFGGFSGVKFNQGVSGSIPDKMTPFRGKFIYYFNGGRDLNDGFRENGEWRITNFDAKLGYELPDDGGGIRVGVKHIEDAISNPGALTVPEFHADPKQTTNPLDGRKFRNTIVQINADKRFLGQRLLASILADWRINRVRFFTTSRTFPDGVFNPDTDLLITNSRAADIIWQLGYRDSWRWFKNESEVGMESRTGSEYDSQADAFRGVVIGGLPLETERFAKPHSLAIFWRETGKFYDRVIIHAGMRHDFDWLRTRDYLTPASNISRRWRDSSFTTGVTVKPFTFVDVFGNYSQGFRVPTISEIAPFSSGIATDLIPEESDSYEMGTRLRYKNLVQAKFSFFLIDLKNEIAFDSTAISPATPFGQNTNIGRSRRNGIESRIDLIPIPEIDAYTSYTWMKAYVRETNSSGVPFDGKDLGLIPSHRFTMGSTVRPLYRLGTPFDGLSISLDGFFTGRQFVQSHESMAQTLIDVAGETIDPYMVWNLMIVFEWKGKQIYFKINNLFDRDYYSRAVAATNFGSGITPAGTHLFVNPGAPREYVIGTKWEFGN